MAADHYEILGVAPDARHAHIRASYRRLMREYHPDLRPGDPSAEEMTRRLTAAWAVVGRPSARAVYDRQRSAAQQPPPPVVRRSADGPPAYSPVGAHYRRAFHLASLRVAAVVFGLGVVLLVSFSR